MKEQFVRKQKVPQGIQVQLTFSFRFKRSHKKRGRAASQLWMHETVRISTRFPSTGQQPHCARRNQGAMLLCLSESTFPSVLWALAILLQSCAVMCMEPDCTMGDTDWEKRWPFSTQTGEGQSHPNTPQARSSFGLLAHLVCACAICLNNR